MQQPTNQPPMLINESGSIPGQEEDEEDLEGDETINLFDTTLITSLDLSRCHLQNMSNQNLEELLGELDPAETFLKGNFMGAEDMSNSSSNLLINPNQEGSQDVHSLSFGSRNRF